LSQPVWLVLALVLALPPLLHAWTLSTSAAYLVEFVAGARWRPLSAITPVPTVRALAVSRGRQQIPADLYTRASLLRPTGLVLVHGLSPQGKDDLRLRAAAALLARAGWAVAVPTVDGLAVLRLRPDDAVAVVETVRALARAGYGSPALLSVSVGAGPALLAAADPEVASALSAVLALGGYASAVELLRYTLTGAYRLDRIGGRRPVDEAAIAQFARANAELLDATGRRLVENRDPQAVDRLVAALPPTTRQLLTDLSPATHLARIRAPLYLIHGRDDPAVPFTESLRLARAAQEAHRTVTTTIIGSVSHVEPEERAGPGDLLRLAATFYAFAVTARTASPPALTSAVRVP
jgi:fermentation-respiration switch protein FrsA (DUF1100 family)